MLSLEKQNAWRERYRALNPDWRPATEVFAAEVRACLPPEGRLLDVGCGRGGLIEQLAHPLARSVGLDPDWLSLVEHRLVWPRAAGFSHALPFADGAFEVVFASWLLEHLATPDRDLAEISRVLRPGGAFVFITPNARHPLSGLNRSLGYFAGVQGRLVARFYGRASEDAFPTRYRANTRGQLEELATAASLRLATLDAIPDPTYLAFTPALFGLMCRVESWLPPERGLHLVGVMRK